MIIVGCDPGFSGAFAFLNTQDSTLRIIDMPIFEWETTRTRKMVDPYEIGRELAQQPVHHIYLEEVWSSPQMGVVSAFSFGMGRGIILGVAAQAGLPLTEIKPSKWKKELKVSADKAMAVKRATQLFPSAHSAFKGPRGGILDGRAEAALLAFYGALELGFPPQDIVKLVE